MKKDILEYVGSGLSIVFTAIQTNEVFQIVSLILAILTSATTLAFTLWKWYKKAKEDGKITPDEMIEGAKIVEEGIKEIKDIKDKHEGENDK